MAFLLSATRCRSGRGACRQFCGASPPDASSSKGTPAKGYLRGGGSWGQENGKKGWKKKCPSVTAVPASRGPSARPAVAGNPPGHTGARGRDRRQGPSHLGSRGGRSCG